jgi:uncharacterized protein YcbK (DUF882 family)
MTGSHDDGKTIARRRVLALAAPFVLSFSPFAAAAASRVYGERAISLLNLHTGESLSTIYWQDGRYIPESLRRINKNLRDWRNEKQTVIEPSLIDLLHDLRRRLETRTSVHVISGYRSPETNRSLRRASTQVARNSLHMKGEAIDVVLPDRDLRAIRRVALEMQRGGVGYYPRSGYVHLDVGPVRTW